MIFFFCLESGNKPKYATDYKIGIGFDLCIIGLY